MIAMCVYTGTVKWLYARNAETQTERKKIRFCVYTSTKTKKRKKSFEIAIKCWCTIAGVLASPIIVGKEKPNEILKIMVLNLSMMLTRLVSKSRKCYVEYICLLFLSQQSCFKIFFSFLFNILLFLSVFPFHFSLFYFLLPCKRNEHSQNVRNGFHVYFNMNMCVFSSSSSSFLSFQSKIKLRSQVVITIV